jgi:spermidine/putrescine transport system substrate-binding protein
MMSCRPLLPRLALALVTLVLPGLLVGCDKAAAPIARELNVYIWSEYIPQDIVDDFARRFDCKVNLSHYEDLEEMTANLEGDGASRFDIVVPSDFLLPDLVDRGLLAPLRRENLPNLKHVESRFLDPAYDPGNLFSAPYLWGTVGLYTRLDIPVERRTWGLLFDPSLQPGTFALMDSKREMVGPALLYLGHDPNTTDPAALADAEKLLLGARERAKGFLGGVEGKNAVLAGSLDLALSYNGDALRGIAENGGTRFFLPQEGGTLWVDSLAVPAKAPHRDLAETFINFILDPEIGARLANYNHQATPNRLALERVEPQDRQNPAIYPSPTDLTKLRLLQNLGSDNTLYDRLWERLRPAR